MPKKKQETARRPERKPVSDPNSDSIPLYRRKARKLDRVSPDKDAVEKDLPHAHVLAPSHFVLHEDGNISTHHSEPAAPQLILSSDSPWLRLYHGNCLELLDAIAARYPEGRFDAIFADPPYFLSNGGITCHAGRMVKVDKGDWDKSQGPDLNHEFNKEWLLRCQRVLKPNGTIWVSGTLHVIFSIGFAIRSFSRALPEK